MILLQIALQSLGYNARAFGQGVLAIKGTQALWITARGARLTELDHQQQHQATQ